MKANTISLLDLSVPSSETYRADRQIFGESVTTPGCRDLRHPPREHVAAEVAWQWGGAGTHRPPAASLGQSEVQAERAAAECPAHHQVSPWEAPDY